MSNENDSKKKIIAVLKLVFLIALLAGISLFLYRKFGTELFSKDFVYKLEAYLEQHKAGAAWTIIGIQIVQVIICILPGQPVQFAASYIFGIFRGFLLSIIGAVIGTTISFMLARVFGRDFIELLFDKEKVDYYHKKLNSGRGLLLVLLIYLLPGVPKDLVSYIAGISGLHIRPFLLVSTIGRSPGMIGSLLLGYFFGKRNYTAIAVLAIITVAILIIFFMKRKEIIGILDKIEAKEELKTE
ncbi:MAG: TVP38/TMEM64 family protein [Mogibacterium sp.]|nr:TVP38/TMEM64 family protein [Mogibacterium sp.]